MKILIAPCAYKGTIPASSLAAAIAQGIIESDTNKQIEVELLPVADGGDDTLSCLHLALGGEMVVLEVTGPTSQKVEASYLRLGQLAIIELAQGSGIAHLDASQLAPLTAHTYGTGELIDHAIKAGATKIVVTLGGSASTDGGSGILAALGARFVDGSGDDTVFGGGLITLKHLELGTLPQVISGVDFVIATDVDSPLLGPGGAAAVFSPQKGASDLVVEELEKALENFATLLELATGRDQAMRLHPGAGAAGGAGYGLAMALNASFISGFHWLAEQTNLARRIDWCDLIVVAEGSLDQQSLAGKGCGELLKLARAAGKEIVALPACSSISDDQAKLFTAIIPTATTTNKTGSPLATLETVKEAAKLISGVSSRS